MIKSMTGFGRCEAENASYRITVEMKAVNHRYLDLGLKIPKKFNAFEAAIREQLKRDVQRGKVDIYVTYEDRSEAKGTIRYQPALAGEYMKALAQIERDFGVRNDVTVSTLARFPEVLSVEQTEADEETLWQLLSEALAGATEQFVEQRITEGERLRSDLIAKLDGMLEGVAYIESRSPETVREYRERLEEKVRELIGDGQRLEESRILTEVTIFADKICVDEETVRLRSHIRSMKDTLLAGGGIGRKLDFLAQEMNREANTILSKANDIQISQRAIDLKTEIEKVREQIQNIE